MLYPGSVVFLKPARGVDVSRCSWWHFIRGADWRHPLGPSSSIQGMDNYPVVHVAYRDVEAYAKWVGKDLPTEAEWEFAARGGLDGVEFAWGSQLYQDGQHMANTWQGEFPWQNLRSDGYERTSPVDTFPANGFGVSDMIGNVWEWTTDWYHPRHPAQESKACCIPQNPRGGNAETSCDPMQPGIKIPRRVLKGGSHLCAPNYCRRYRPAARFAHAVDTSTCHVGFRCIVRAPQDCRVKLWKEISGIFLVRISPHCAGGCRSIFGSRLAFCMPLWSWSLPMFDGRRRRSLQVRITFDSRYLSLALSEFPTRFRHIFQRRLHPPGQRSASWPRLP